MKYREFSFWNATILIIMALHCSAANSEQVEVKLAYEFTGGGQLIASVFDSEASFLKSPIDSMIVNAEPSGASVLHFELQPERHYAISVIYDENNNNELDTNLFGIPSEGVGTSNNPSTRFGPPNYEDAAFLLPRGSKKLDLEIKIKDVF